MKRAALAALGLMGVLASCNVTVTGPTAQPVTITQLNSYTSDYYYETVENGQTKRNYVICNDRQTRLYLDVSWSGPLSQLGARFTTTRNGSTSSKEVSTNVFGANTSGRDTFTYTIGAGALPLSARSGGPTLAAQKLAAQAIVVTPSTMGNVAVDIWGYNPDGLKSRELQAPGTIPIVASCA
ncbi:hypothetical protein [Deinococcus multiflagellatus]|uniref:Lipoprotein n=1 Tax=Deinococcus multiflagellatus TaxID=1656887 RepID=A0ABW1ZEY1_9DEIO|nr:hypothetical protein [Deinococcus multiflagellatus]MBZ9712116.1 hypothetical protein [Deinococcus multiflagellatus]